MAAYNTEYAVLEQSPKPQEPLYHLLVQLIMTPTYEAARELYWTLVDMRNSKFTTLSAGEVRLLEALSSLLQVLQFDRKLDTAHPLWLITLRLTQELCTIPSHQLHPVIQINPARQKPVVYVLRRKITNSMQYTVVATNQPLYTEQVFTNKDMAEYALYRNQPFASVYDNYFYNSNYGAGAPKYFRRIV